MGEVAEAEGGAAEVFEAAVDGLCRRLGYADLGGVLPCEPWFGRGGCRHNPVGPAFS